MFEIKAYLWQLNLTTTLGLPDIKITAISTLEGSTTKQL